MAQHAPPANLNKAHLSSVHPDGDFPSSSSNNPPLESPPTASGTAPAAFRDPSSSSADERDEPASTSGSGSGSASGPGATSDASIKEAYSSFTPPFPASTPFPRFSIVVEFCDRCRWVHRATWTQTELLATFGEKKEEEGASGAGAGAGGKVKSVTLMPMTSEETGGRFRVWVYGGGEEGGVSCVWDRKVKGGFPELKELKQAVRDVISPSQSLGHSDHDSKKGGVADRGPTTTSDAHNPAGKGADGQEPAISGTGHEPNTGTATTD